MPSNLSIMSRRLGSTYTSAMRASVEIPMKRSRRKFTGVAFRDMKLLVNTMAVTDSSSRPFIEEAATMTPTCLDFQAKYKV